MTNPLSGLGTGWLSSLINAQFPNAPTQTSQFNTIVQGQKGTDEYTQGNGILSTLSLPNGLKQDTPFTWAVQRQVSKGNTPGSAIQGPIQAQSLGGLNHDPNVSTLTQMTMAGAMSYLRELAIEGQGKTDSDYNAIVHQLVAAGYLSPTDAKYGSFTTKVANAFLSSAADVWGINKDGGAGQLVAWQDHINSMIQSREAAGLIDSNGLTTSGSGGGSAVPTAPTRTDVYTNPQDVKSAVNTAAEDILGRQLTAAEVGAFQSMFHGLEKTYNDKAWSQQMAAYQQNVSNSTTPNTAPDAVRAPSTADAAKNYMDGSSAFNQERTTQLLGSYMGVLRSMTGLGSGGVSRAVS